MPGFNLAMPLVIINFALADLIGLGSAVPISIKLGSKDEKEANNYFTCASIMVVLAGILSGAVLALGGRTFLSWMGAQGELLDQATQPIWLPTPSAPRSPPLSLPWTITCASAGRSAAAWS